MSFWKKAKSDGLLSAIGLEVSKIPFVKPIINIAAAFYPQVKDVAVALGVSTVSYAAIPEAGTIEQKLTALAVAGVTYLVHKLCYYAKDYLDNGKLDQSVKES